MMQIPYPVEGEILKVEKRAAVGERNIIRYTCRVNMPNGSQMVLPHVETTSGLGGISDYFIMRHRASFDSSDVSDFPTNQNERDAMIGERVIIQFVNGNILHPIITSFKQHPNQTPELIGADKKDPEAVLQILGIRVEIDEEGSLKFIHKGAPEVDFDPQNSSALDANILGIKQEAAAKAGESSIGGDNNGAIVPADKSEVTLWEMLKRGVFKLRDAEGQGFAIDQDAGLLLLSNNLLPSWMSPDAPQASQYTGLDGEYIQFDSGGGRATINSSKLTEIISNIDREDTTDGKYSHDVTGTYTVNIQDNESRSVTGGSDLSVERNYTIDVTGNYSVTSKQVVEIEGSGGKLKLSQGTVALGGPGAELLDLFDKTLDRLDMILTNIQALTVLGNLGLASSPPINIADFILDDADVKKIKAQLGLIKGSL